MTAAAPLNLSWATESLAVAGEILPHEFSVLVREHGVRHIVDVREEAQDDAHVLASHGIEFLHLPTPDHQPLTPESLQQGVDWVLLRVARGERVCIHCQHGIGRSVLLALCVLVRLGKTPHDALVCIKSARDRASPSPLQLTAYLTYCGALFGDLPTWDQLAAIAYAHKATVAADLPLPESHS
jgi:protein-tyrosine phosphatase